MRIVSGSLKGRRFSPPASFKARPTTDQARESLFNILNNLIDFEDQKVLDLFGGTGAMSYEFASRGCQSVLCVEKKYAHYKFILTTIHDLKLKDQITISKNDVFDFLARNTDPFTLIFADPPFDLSRLTELPSTILNSPAMNENTLFVLEHGPAHSFENEPGFWQTRKYGKVNFSFFRKS